MNGSQSPALDTALVRGLASAVGLHLEDEEIEAVHQILATQLAPETDPASLVSVIEPATHFYADWR